MLVLLCVCHFVISDVIIGMQHIGYDWSCLGRWPCMVTFWRCFQVHLQVDQSSCSKSEFFLDETWISSHICWDTVLYHFLLGPEKICISNISFRQWRSQGGRGNCPPWLKLCPPNEITLCTEVYGELPFWVPGSQRPRSLVSPPCRLLIMKSLAMPLHFDMTQALYKPGPRFGHVQEAGSTAHRKWQGKLKISWHWHWCNWDMKRSFHFKPCSWGRHHFIHPWATPKIIFPPALDTSLNPFEKFTIIATKWKKHKIYEPGICHWHWYIWPLLSL